MLATMYRHMLCLCTPFSKEAGDSYVGSDMNIFDGVECGSLLQTTVIGTCLTGAETEAKVSNVLHNYHDIIKKELRSVTGKISNFSLRRTMP